MEIEYRNLSEDYRAYFWFRQLPQRPARRATYYYAVAWNLVVVSLGFYLAVKYEEIFAACVFVALAALYIVQNWSFDKRWNDEAANYSSKQPETSNRLTLDDQGIRESFSGLLVGAEWSSVHGYSLVNERLFVHYFTDRAFIVPFRDIDANEREQLLSTLAAHRVSRRD